MFNLYCVLQRFGTVRDLFRGIYLKDAISNSSQILWNALNSMNRLRWPLGPFSGHGINRSAHIYIYIYIWYNRLVSYRKLSHFWPGKLLHRRSRLHLVCNTMQYIYIYIYMIYTFSKLSIAHSLLTWKDVTQTVAPSFVLQYNAIYIYIYIYILYIIVWY